MTREEMEYGNDPLGEDEGIENPKGLKYATQPEWYLVIKASQVLCMSAVDLNNLEEPDRTFWLRRALVARSAEIEAENSNRSWAQNTSKLQSQFPQH